MWVYYRDKGDRAAYTLKCTQQASAIPQFDPRVKQQLVELALNWAKAENERRKVEVIDEPKVERDDRFLCKVHTRFKEGDNTWDVVYAYKALGLNLISLNSATYSENKNQIAAVHDNAAKLLMSVTVAAQDPKIVRPVNGKPDEK
jgi:hypothetical protein